MMEDGKHADETRDELVAQRCRWMQESCRKLGNCADRLARGAWPPEKALPVAHAHLTNIQTMLAAVEEVAER